VNTRRKLSSLRGVETDCSPLACRLYSQDASIYQETPLGVAFPRNKKECALIVEFARKHSVSLIPRAGGTSLAGQCVGNGLVVDVSRHMTRILEINTRKCHARVQPGVIQDDLNAATVNAGLKFAPDTSTSKQATISGMVGNNSCGAYSILYGTTRDHVLEIEAILSDGSVVIFGTLSNDELDEKKKLPSLEGKIYRVICSIIDGNLDSIASDFPTPQVTRRNMGYAIDRLAQMQPWNPKGDPFSLAPLICGSEGTLCLITEIVIKLVPVPRHISLICAHFDSIQKACRAIAVIQEHQPAAVELLDGILLNATHNNREQADNRFWVEGDPGAVLAIELHDDQTKQLQRRVRGLCNALKSAKLGYASRILQGSEIQRVWDLRKAALGLLTGMPGDTKPVTAIEDTAVNPADLPAYAEQIDAMMKSHGCECVFYGHAAAGLLHLRPMLNLKEQSGLNTFSAILNQTADIVKKFGGSLSGEHGDGRLRGHLLEQMLTPETYKLLVEIKRLFDPANIMNPGKIIDAPNPLESLRTHPGSRTPEIDTIFDWSAQKGMVRAVERCNGAGFCRQSPGHGTMCPSYMATNEEAYTTRGRANVLRQLLVSEDPAQTWSNPDLSKVMDECLSCKACASECPSSVDMARLKAEYQQKRKDHTGGKLRDRMFGFYAVGARFASIAPKLASAVINTQLVKKILGIAPERHMPPFASQTFTAWLRKHQPPECELTHGKVVVFNDEFTDYTDPEPGIAVTQCLEMLGFDVIPVGGLQSGRSLISKGFLRSARRKMSATVEVLYDYAKNGIYIVGVEPSAILGFRDEAPDLVPPELRSKAERVKEYCLLFDEFIVQELREGRLTTLPLKPLSSKILLHGHCHQKAIAGISATTTLLRLIPEAQVEEIAGGCCGMAGSFGYEKEHYELSMRIGELTLFPAIRNNPNALICAPGTSCRHQIMDGTDRVALHPAQILLATLI